MESAANSLQQLLDFLCRLEKSKIVFHLQHNRDESIMVLIAVPGERWEVEFFADGSVEVEIFGGSKGKVSGRESCEQLARLFDLHGE